jgi:hypothetical protein
MATPDHTVLTRLSNSQGDILIPVPSGSPLSAEAAELVQQRLLSGAAGMARAIEAVTCLLTDSDAYQCALARQRPAVPSHWPLSTDADGLAVLFTDAINTPEPLAASPKPAPCSTVDHPPGA